MCCSTGPANFVGSPGAAGQTPLPLTAYAWGVSVTLRAASIGEAALIFSTAPAPRGEQAKAADSLPKRNGAALHSVVIPPNDSGKRPAVYLPAGRHFFKEYPMREDDRPFWQEVREELSPRRNPIGWVCVLAILGMFCLVGYFDHPAELHMRPAIIVSK